MTIKNKEIFIPGACGRIQAKYYKSKQQGASVALVLAAMVANGKSTINRIYHLDRGYEKLEIKLRKVGVRIKRTS